MVDRVRAVSYLGRHLYPSISAAPQIRTIAIVESVIGFLFEGRRSQQHFTKAAIAPYLRGNDYTSEIERYQRLTRKNFAP